MHQIGIEVHISTIIPNGLDIQSVRHSQSEWDVLAEKAGQIIVDEYGCRPTDADFGIHHTVQVKVEFRKCIANFAVLRTCAVGAMDGVALALMIPIPERVVLAVYCMSSGSSLPAVIWSVVNDDKKPEMCFTAPGISTQMQ